MTSYNQASAVGFILPRPWIEKPAFAQHREAVLSLVDGFHFDAKQLDPESPLGNCLVRVRNPTQEEIAHTESRTGRGGTRNVIALELCSHEYDLAQLASQVMSSNDSELSREEQFSVATHYIATELETLLHGMLSLWNICYFGCLNSLHHIAYVDDDLIDSGGRCEFRTLWAIDDESSADLPLRRIDPTKALIWSTKCSGFWTGDAETRLQRAVACLLRTFSTRLTGMDTYGTLLWSLAGLEALYCDSESAIKYQIRRRAPLVVKAFRLPNLDRRISKGYDFRSRLFHGDLKIRSPLADRDSDYEDQKHHEIQADEYADFFCLLLTCSILAGIEAGAQELHFTETCAFDPT